MLNVVIFFIFLAVWVLPSFRRQGKKGMPARKWYVLDILTMATAGFIVSTAVQIGGTYLLNAISPGYVVRCLLEAFLNAALVEEACKFFGGRIYLRRSGAVRKIDYIFLLGAAGMGFEITESLLGMDGGGVAGGIVKGVFALHVFWQMHMGAHYYEYVRAKEAGDLSAARKECRRAFLVPGILHGLNDFGLFLVDPAVEQGVENLSDAEGYLLAAGMFIFVVTMVLNVILVVRTLKTVKRTADESREAEETQPAEEAPCAE